MRIEYTVFVKDTTRYGEETRHHFDSEYKALNCILGLMQDSDDEVVKVLKTDYDRMEMKEMMLKLEGFKLHLVYKVTEGQFG